MEETLYEKVARLKKEKGWGSTRISKALNIKVEKAKGLISKYDHGGKVCYFCGSTYRLAKHHYISRFRQSYLRDRTVTLCSSCHPKLHSILGMELVR